VCVCVCARARARARARVYAFWMQTLDMVAETLASSEAAALQVL